MAASPTQLTLKLMRERGYYAEVVERYNSFTRTRNDFAGFIDVLCLGDGEVVGVQTTSYGNMSARIKKIREHENLIVVHGSGIRIIVQGWIKRNNRWQLKEVEIERGMEGYTVLSELPSIKHGSDKKNCTPKKPRALRCNEPSGEDSESREKQ